MIIPYIIGEKKEDMKYSFDFSKSENTKRNLCVK